MTYFDDSLSFAPVAEQSSDPVLPEDRHIFELIGLERSEPDQFRKDGGIKWTWRVFNADGSPFTFKDEQYLFWRTTSIDRSGRPLMNKGTFAYDWTSAMLGRELGIDETLNPRALRNKKMSAMVVWEKQRSDPTKKSVKLASLRHVPTGEAQAFDADGIPAKPAPVDERVGLLALVQKLLGEALVADAEGADKLRSEFKKSGREWDVAKLHGFAETIQARIDEAKQAVPF